MSPVSSFPSMGGTRYEGPGEAPATDEHLKSTVPACAGRSALIAPTQNPDN